MPNHNLFDDWNEQSAYVLGFWVADGGISLIKHRRKLYKCFRIFNTDTQITKSLSKILGQHYTTSRRHANHKPEHQICIYSDKLFDFCYNITNNTNKSHAAFGLPAVPIHLFHHFVRGFFDGDGSIYYKHYKNRHNKITTALGTSFTGGCETSHIDQLQQWLRRNVGLGNKKISGRLHKKLNYNQYDSMLLCEFMYKNATIFMKRKKDIWDSADKTKLLHSMKYFSNKV
jgi:hypothetical protein